MKIGVVGNCQASGFAKSLGVAVPDADVVLVGVAGLQPDDDLGAKAEPLYGCDVVFSHRMQGSRWGPLQFDNLATRVKRLLGFPALLFTGFHPDCVYLNDADGAQITGACGPYHSAVTAACFLEGLDYRRAFRLHNAYTYGRLGYFDRYHSERLNHRRLLGNASYNLKWAFQETPVIFMHTVNHPTIDASHAFARQAVRVVGLIPQSGPLPEDELAKGYIWPVYPEIAQRIGVPGSSVFRLRDQRISLAELVEDAYAVYAKQTPVSTPPALERARSFIKEQVICVSAT